MQRIFVYSLLSFLTLSTLVVFWLKNPEDLQFLNLYKTKHKQAQTLRVGIMDWPGFYPLAIALKDKSFENKSFKIELIKGNDNDELNAFLETGKVDLCFGAFADYLLMRGNNKKIKFIYATDFSKSDIVVADKNVKSFKDLKNKKIGITALNSFSEFFIQTLLEKSKISESSISFKVIPFDQITEKIELNIISAGHTWEPETTRAINKGYHVIATSYEIKGIITDGLVATEDILESNFSHVVELIKILNIYQNKILTLTDNEVKYLATEFSSTDDIVKSSIKNGVEFLNLKQNLEIFTSQENYALRKWTEKISTFYSQRGQLKDVVNPDDILDQSVLLEAIKGTENETSK
jgi:NitT/TauT family transport system substrate-binding protein